jgi:exosortase
MKSDTDAIQISPGRAAFALVVLVLVLVALFWHFVSAQVFYSYNYLGDWGHTFIVPLITAYLVWIDRDRLLSSPFKSAPTGFAVVVFGILLYVLTLFGPGFIQVHNAKAVGISVTLYGVAIIACGWTSLRVLWFPLLYLVVFGQFISPQLLAPITERMQDFAAAGSYFMFEVLGYTTSRVGNLITLESNGSSRPLDVAEACSGMKMLMAFLALGTFVAWTGLPRLWQRVVLVLLGLPIAIVVNILRITTQGILDSYDTGFSVGAAHSTISMLWLIPALLLFLFFMWMLEPFAPEDESPEPKPVDSIAVTPGTRAACIGLLLLLFFAAIGIHIAANTTGFKSIKSPAPLRASLDSLPLIIGDWIRVGGDVSYEDTVIETLGTTLYVDRAYALQGDPERGVLQVHIAFYTGGATNRPHVPERCWAVQGLTASRDPELLELAGLAESWSVGNAVNSATGESYPVVEIEHPVTRVRQTVHLPIGDPAVRVTLFADPRNPELRMVGGYFFIANGRMTPNAMAVRPLAYNFSSTHAYFCKVQFTYLDFGSALTDDELVQHFRDLVEGMMVDLMPEVMKVLPDWPAYEVTARDGS